MRISWPVTANVETAYEFLAAIWAFFKNSVELGNRDDVPCVAIRTFALQGDNIPRLDCCAAVNGHASPRASFRWRASAALPLSASRPSIPSEPCAARYSGVPLACRREHLVPPVMVSCPTMIAVVELIARAFLLRLLERGLYRRLAMRIRGAVVDHQQLFEVRSLLLQGFLR